MVFTELEKSSLQYEKTIAATAPGHVLGSEQYKEIADTIQ